MNSEMNTSKPSLQKCKDILTAADIANKQYDECVHKVFSTVRRLKNQARRASESSNRYYRMLRHGQRL